MAYLVGSHLNCGVSGFALALAVTSLVPGGAMAQAVSNAASARTQAAAGGANQDAAAGSSAAGGAQSEVGVQDIVVTASRITANGYQAPTPTTVFGANEIQKVAPVQLADAINQLPQFWGSTLPRGVNLNFGPAFGGNFLNLRGLGANRTLVLVNGRRVPPETATANVDINLIPESIVSRVDVVTGGASASWGSDAVGGVVNFILDTKFEGLKGTLEGGVSSRGDGGNQKVALTYGTGFAGGRGHFVVSGLYSHVDEIDNLNTRSWYNATKLVRNPTWAAGNGQPYYIVASHVGAANLTDGGLITAVSGGAPASLVGTSFLPGGGTSRFQFGQVVPGGTLQLGGSFQDVAVYNPIQPSADQRIGFAHLSYDFTDAVSAFVEGSGGRSITRNLAGTGPQGAGDPFPAIVIQAGNPFIPAAIAAQLPPGSSFTMGRLNLDAYRQIPRTRRDTFNVVGGINVRLPGDWKFDAFAQYGKSIIDFNVFGNPLPARMAEVTDVIAAPAGNAAGVPVGTPICRSTLANPTNGCVPFNPFGYGAPSSQAAAYASATAHQKLTLKEKLASGQVSGSPFSTWAGKVSLVVGAEARRESIVGTADALSIANQFRIGNYKPISGAFTVVEGFAEVDVPLLAEQRFFKLVDVTGAVRRTHYTTSGSVTTWKLGLNWSVDDQLRFRATRSRDIRAPNLNELFASPTSSTTSLAGFGTISTVTQGNINLTPEISDQWGIGAVLRPNFVRGFGASIDYYNIKLKNAIATPQAAQAVQYCLQGQAFFCSLVTFNAANAPVGIVIQPINAAAEAERGLDIELSYRSKLEGLHLPGEISLRALGTHMFERSVTFGGVKTNLLGNVGATFGAASGVPKWRGRFETGYTIGASTTTVVASYIGPGVVDPAFTEGGNQALLSIDHNGIKSNTVFTLSETIDIRTGEKRNMQFFFVVDNLFDKHPPVVVTAGDSQFTTGTSALYDTIGRQFRAGVRFRL